MAKDRLQVADVDAWLVRWRDHAGADWQAIFRHRLEIHGQAFAGRSDPLDAWAAILLSRVLGEAPPGWVMDYLATSAANIHELQTESFNDKTITPAMIGRAFGMVSGGAGTAFLGPKACDWVAVAIQVRDAIKAGDKKDFATEIVAAANGVSKSTADKYWKRFQAECPELL